VEVNASISHVRISTRKVAILGDQIRGKDINAALNYLRMSPRKRTAGIIQKLVKSAVSNADQKGTVDVDNLYVKTLLVGQGPTLKRFMPRAKGAASKILKRTSHIKVTLSER
jgi:large subunit ribosomal protein L22